jgi:DNA-binding GntR family transcriptional regulator
MRMPFLQTDERTAAQKPDKPGKAARLSQSLPKANAQHGMAHRMANDIGVAIVNGELQDGARILEEELAAHYGVSRSPVREAIALLERRGLVRTEPRRGTYVVGFTPNLIADLFNVRGVLMGLAARYVARQRDPQALADLQEVTQALAEAARQPDITPLHFAKLANGLGVTLLRHCGSDVLRRMVNDHGHLTSWGMLWRQRPVDFITDQRRQDMVRDYETLCRLLAAWDDVGCEAWLRKMLDDNRDNVLNELAKWRDGTVDAQFLVRDLPRTDPAGTAAAGGVKPAAAKRPR